MKLHKLVLIGFVIIFASGLALPTGSFACWGTGNYMLECCFVCCETETDCDNYYNPEGGDYNCRFNWYCLVNPFFCLETCPELDPDLPPFPCPFFTALNNDKQKIEMLRRFRDEVLAKTPVGREYIRLYYRWSPVVVHIMKEDEELKEKVKALLEELLPLIEKTLQ